MLADLAVLSSGLAEKLGINIIYKVLHKPHNTFGCDA